ncbi:MAG TPA: preprotein translocase subunit SecA [Rhodospirillaceae bacterium]|nr:MAG: preprotein translocase subunit SecA [Alphaproteobacteria bacterium GWF2_58_20]HAU29754.1 preprotein translocase subunit SecA [Rhodospirillaceae bacterium]
MFREIARKLVGTHNDRLIRKLMPVVAQINALEESYAALSDDEVRGLTPKFRARLENGEMLDDILPEAFAAVREAAKRTLGQRHFDVQLIGGMVLHQGRIAEMKTGEGKTLVATLPVYLNALSGKGVHVVTVNDYLARRDAEWMGQVYRFLGLSVGTIGHDMPESERRASYASDVTYGTNYELGFDYLRDNMKMHTHEMVQRPFNFAIVDEVDSILIDEARTPLIISGEPKDSSQLYISIDKVIRKMVPEDFEKDEKTRTVALTEIGVDHVEKLLAEAGLIEGDNLYDIANIDLVHHVNQALRAHQLFNLDDHYIVKDNQVIIIDEFTGRMMPGRRFSEGLHQALEAKEHAVIQHENQTLASITYQNYFKLYAKLAGMTGTASTEASEFADIYNLDVITIPTNRPTCRKDNDDEIYRTAREKYAAIVDLIRQCHARQQPVLVGTISIEKSQILGELLENAKIPHHVLNAKHHEREAEIVSQAGQPGAVTIATNMAGRGTDIQLGGNPDMMIKHALTGEETPEEKAAIEKRIREEAVEAKKVAQEAGGLYILGTERHEARRIDNQLRGRSGRQGDPGESKFFLSLEDDLMRIFGAETLNKIMLRLGIQEGEAIIHPWVNKAIATAQRKVEEQNFEIRKNLLKYDNVINDQRKVVYEQRREMMAEDDVSESVRDMRHDVVEDIIHRFAPPGSYAEQWDIEGFGIEVRRVFGLELPFSEWSKEDGVDSEVLQERIRKASDARMAEKAVRFKPEVMRYVEKQILLRRLDQYWREHILNLDHLRQGINLRAYGQKDPLNEYKREAFELFEALLIQLRETVTRDLSFVEIQVDTPPAQDVPPTEEFALRDNRPVEDGDGKTKPASRTEAKASEKISRNAACPCGSGKKYKHCCGSSA